MTKLTCHSWHGSTEMSYNQSHTREGIPDMGYWTVFVEKCGIYRFHLSRWPREADTPLCSGLPALVKPHTEGRPAGRAYDLEEGLADLKAYFICESRSTIGAYCCYVELLDEKGENTEMSPGAYGASQWA